jgi:phosphoribosylformylglycinamidine cyclo-ligase
MKYTLLSKMQIKDYFLRHFVKYFPDHLTGDGDYCSIIHADGAGTKSVLAYLYWKETGDLSVWKGISQDAIVMNTDDLICVGATSNFLLSSIINRNKHLIPGEVIKALIDGTNEVVENAERERVCAYIQWVVKLPTWVMSFVQYQ